MDIALRQTIPLFNQVFSEFINFDDIASGEDLSPDKAVKGLLEAKTILDDVQSGYTEALDKLGLDHFRPSDAIGLVANLTSQAASAQSLLGKLAVLAKRVDLSRLNDLDRIDLGPLKDAERYKERLRDAKKYLGKIRTVVDALRTAEREKDKVVDKLKFFGDKLLEKTPDLKKALNGLNKARNWADKVFGGKKRRRKRDLSGDIRSLERDIDAAISGLDRLKGTTELITTILLHKCL